MNNPLKYTDPSGYIFQGPVEPEAPYWTAGGTMFQVPYQGTIPSGGYSVGTVDWLGSFETAFDDVTNQRGFSKRILQKVMFNSAISQLKRNRKKVVKVEIMGNFLVFTTCPSPKNLISNMQLLYNEEFGIYVQKDKSSGDYYQPYSDIKVDPGALVYNAKLEAFLKSMSGGAGHGLSFDGGPPDQGRKPLISHPRGIEGTSSWYNLKVRLENLDQLLEGDTYHADDPSNSSASTVLSIVSHFLPSSSVLLSFYKLTEGSDPITGQKIALTEQS